MVKFKFPKFKKRKKVKLVVKKIIVKERKPKKSIGSVLAERKKRTQERIARRRR